MKSKILIPVVAALLLPAGFNASANEDSADEIVKKLSNPLAKIMSIPVQQNVDFGAGPDGNGAHYYMKIQPVIPITISDDIVMVSRTILKLESKHNMGLDNPTGLGDTSQTFWFAPNGNWNGWMAGAGPVLYLPTATNAYLGAKKFGIGPSAIVLRQTSDWTYGVLGSQTWSVAGDENRPDINSTFAQGFVSYKLPDAWTITAAADYTRDNNTDIQSIPAVLIAAKVVKIGKLPLSFSFGGKYYLDSPAGGPEWGVLGGVTVVLPNLFAKYKA